MRRTGHLTERERQVLRLVGAGFNSREIAQQLLISVKTVHVHRQNIYRKFGIASLADLVWLALREDASNH